MFVFVFFSSEIRRPVRFDVIFVWQQFYFLLCFTSYDIGVSGNLQDVRKDIMKEG